MSIDTSDALLLAFAANQMLSAVLASVYELSGTTFLVMNSFLFWFVGIYKVVFEDEQ